MKTVQRALALVLAVALGARADEAKPEGGQGSASHASGGGHGGDTGLVLLDVFLNLFTLGVEAAAIEDATATAPPPPDGRLAQRARSSDDGDPPPRAWRARRPQAREGLLMSFGIGGGSMFTSYQNEGRTGAFDFDFRLGYGFSDRFQLFMDIDLAGANFATGDDIASWAFTLRGQTVLIGDRAGNGLNLNLGIGTGGITVNSGYYDQASSPSGLALAGGISYDARVSPWFALSPEFFVTWHAIPNGPHLPQDVASLYGVRLNFVWYLH